MTRFCHTSAIRFRFLLRSNNKEESPFHSIHPSLSLFVYGPVWEFRGPVRRSRGTDGKKTMASTTTPSKIHRFCRLCKLDTLKWCFVIIWSKINQPETPDMSKPMCNLQISIFCWDSSCFKQNFWQNCLSNVRCKSWIHKRSLCRYKIHGAFWYS